MQPDGLFQIPQFTLGAPHREGTSFVYNGDSGRIVTPIFKLPQALEYDANYLFVAYVSDYSAHVLFTSISFEFFPIHVGSTHLASSLLNGSGHCRPAAISRTIGVSS
jgi:hypothetical protein